MSYSPQQIQIESAVYTDSNILTDIAFSAKRTWNYPEEYYKIWEKELTITELYLQENIVYKALLKESIIAFYSIVENKSDFYSGEVFVPKGFWLEHIFIQPSHHKLGIGRQLIAHAINTSKELGIPVLYIFVDPNAREFYDKIGANFLYDSKSSIPNRSIPIYHLQIR